MERVELHLEKLTFSQKLDIMETIWDDLSRNQTSYESPGWHEAILMERAAALASGEPVISDWDNTKERIRKTIR